jgi:hypothetical protein
VSAAGLQALLAVQDRDTELDQLRHRRATLSQRAALAAAERELAEIDDRGGALVLERHALEERRQRLEAEVADLERRLNDLDRRMHSGEVTATRELSAMVDQTDAIKRRRSDLEDAELELMVALEPLDEELGTLEGRRVAVAASVDGLRAELAVAEVAIDTQLDEAAAAREKAAADVPGPMLATYDRIRQRLGGIGAARLVGASCGGCHLTLSATELDRIRREPPDALVTCDQCGRILVR